MRVVSNAGPFLGTFLQAFLDRDPEALPAAEIGWDPGIEQEAFPPGHATAAPTRRY